MKISSWIAVLGGATRYTDEQIIAGYEIGRHIAKRNSGLITGGTTGIPYAAAIGAKAEGGLVVGISPAVCQHEHVTRFKKPIEHVDLMVYSGLHFDGRSPLIIRSAVASIFIGGEFGTLNEFTSAWMGGNSIIGILEGFGGTSDSLRKLVSDSPTPFGSKLIFDTSPAALIDKVFQEPAIREVRTSESGCCLTNQVGKTISDYLSKKCVL